MKRFDMEASLAGRPLVSSGLAIQRQATMPAPTGSTFRKTDSWNPRVSAFRPIILHSIAALPF